MDKQTKLKKLQRVLDITRELELRKELYDELDDLIMELRNDDFVSDELENFKLELVDNFEDGKNIVFRPAGVRRYEIAVKPLDAEGNPLKGKAAKEALKRAGGE